MNEQMITPIWGLIAALFCFVALAKGKKPDDATGEPTDEDLFGDVFEGWVGSALGGEWFSLKAGKKKAEKCHGILFARASALSGTYAVPGWALDEGKSDPLFAILSRFDGATPLSDPIIITQSGLVRALAVQVRRCVSIGLMRGVIGPNGFAWSIDAAERTITLNINRQKEGGDRARYLLGSLTIEGHEGQTTLEDVKE
jgi:hypothetical protein